MTRCKWQAVLVFALLAACDVPRIRVESTPAEARLFRDGHALESRTPAELDVPYYGHMLLEAEHEGGDERWAPARRLADVSPPVTRWIFPFDFPLELALRAFGASATKTTLQLVPQPVPELTPQRAKALIETVRKATTAR